MYKCSDCSPLKNYNREPGTRPVRVVTHVRKVNYIQINKRKRNRDIPPEELIGRGTETVKEKVVCPEHALARMTQEPVVTGTVERRIPWYKVKQKKVEEEFDEESY